MRSAAAAAHHWQKPDCLLAHHTAYVVRLKLKEEPVLKLTIVEVIAHVLRTLVGVSQRPYSYIVFS